MNRSKVSAFPFSRVKPIAQTKVYERKVVKDGAKASPHFFRMTLGSLSGPLAL